MRGMKITRAVVPSLFTVLNMFCGFLSMIQSSEGRFDVAAWFIVLATVFDTLDGLMARITRSSSQFGVEIDSLSDVVSFGAAPAFLVYRLMLYQIGGIGLFISSLLLIMGGIRLARFNVQLVGFDKDHFAGLPIPASALTVVSLVLTYRDDSGVLVPWAAAVLPYLVVGVSLLMVSKVQYDTLPKPSLKEFRKHPVKVVSTLGAALILIFTRGEAFFWLCVVFVVFGVIRSLYRQIRKMTGQVGPKEAEEDVEEATSYDI